MKPYTTEQLEMLRSAVEGFLDVQRLYLSSLPPVPQHPTRLAEFFGGFGSRHVQVERDAMIQQAKTSQNNARVILRLIDQLLGEKSFRWATPEVA